MQRYKVLFNQKGYLLPTTLILLFLFSSIILHQLNMYGIEKRFYMEQEQVYLLQYLQQMASYDLLTIVGEESLEEEGLFFYEKGFARYMVTNEIEPNVVIQLHVETDKNRKRTSRLVLNKEGRRIVSWREL